MAPLESSRICARRLQLGAHDDREQAADEPRHDGEDQVHRADVLVVRRIDEPAPSGRVMLVAVIGGVVGARAHLSIPLTRGFA
jgi:hypothetical protein